MPLPLERVQTHPRGRGGGTREDAAESSISERQKAVRGWRGEKKKTENRGKGRKNWGKSDRGIRRGRRRRAERGRTQIPEKDQSGKENPLKLSNTKLHQCDILTSFRLPPARRGSARSGPPPRLVTLPSRATLPRGTSLGVTQAGSGNPRRGPMSALTKVNPPLARCDDRTRGSRKS